MANTKPIGVAYADPEFDSVAVSGAVAAGSVAASGAVTALTLTSASSAAASNAVAGVYFFSTAITANTTTTTAPKGSIGTTSNATGAGKMFISDGAKWQFAAIT
jgi:hypothetical protein